MTQPQPTLSPDDLANLRAVADLCKTHHNRAGELFASRLTDMADRFEAKPKEMTPGQLCQRAFANASKAQLEDPATDEQCWDHAAAVVLKGHIKKSDVQKLIASDVGWGQLRDEIEDL